MLASAILNIPHDAWQKRNQQTRHIRKCVPGKHSVWLLSLSKQSAGKKYFRLTAKSKSPVPLVGNGQSNTTHSPRVFKSSRIQEWFW